MLLEKYDSASKSIKIGSTYYVTEIISKYSYDFSKSAVAIGYSFYGSGDEYVKLDMYEEGYIYKCGNILCNMNPSFTISNWPPDQ